MQDENGDWKLDPAYEEYYKSLEGRTDNSSASKLGDKPTDNATKSSVRSSNKEPAHVKDLNKKNSEGKGKNPLYIPYGEADQLNSNREGGGKKNNDKKPTMPSAKTPRPRPLEYEDGWYEEPSDGQWYNTYDWYEDENGEWAYDYRMEEYGYIQLETGEWVPGPGAEGMQPDQQVPSINSGKTESGQSKSSDSMGALRGGLGSIFGGGKPAQTNSTKAVGDAKPNGSLPQNGATKTNVSKAGQGKEGKTASKDGFSRLFSSEDPSSTTQKTSLPPRPPDYDDYWYQAEDGNWYNEYDDLGYQFADDEILSVATDGKAELSRVSKVSSDPKPAQAVPKPVSASVAKKKPPRPADYEDRYYQDEKGAWRNEYDDRGLEFDDGGDFYSEKELADAEKALFKNGPKASDNKRTVAKADDSVKAVDTTKPVIEKSELVKKAEPAKEVAKVKVVPSESTLGKGSTSSDIPVSSTKSRSGDTTPRVEATKPKKLPRPADYEDQWYQASDGQWYNEYDDTGQEYEDSASDISLTESKRNCAKNVSFDQQSRGSVGGRVSPRQRWQWAYSRIRQVGDRVRLSLLDQWPSRCCKSQCLLFVLM